MSQEKVDRHKEEKKNRTKLMKRQKRQRRLMEGGAVLVAVLVVAWVGVSIYNYSDVSDTTAVVDLPTYEINTSALDDYLMNLDYE